MTYLFFWSELDKEEYQDKKMYIESRKKKLVKKFTGLSVHFIFCVPLYPSHVSCILQLPTLHLDYEDQVYRP